MEGSHDGAVTTQPGTGPVAKEDRDGYIPEGLQKLEKCSSIVIKQNDPLMCSMRCFCQKPNSYYIVDENNDETLFSIREAFQCIFRPCFGAGRELNMRLYDMDETMLGYIGRQQVCTRGCCVCTPCLPSLKMASPPSKRIGFVEERRSCFSPKYDIHNTRGDRVMTIATRCCYWDCCEWFSDTNLRVVTCEKDGETVATVTKKTKKNYEEYIGIENNIYISFVKEMTLQEKLLIIGAVFMIDFNYFEGDTRCFF